MVSLTCMQRQQQQNLERLWHMQVKSILLPQRMTLCCQTLAVLTSLQHGKSATESEKSRWMNSGCRPNEQLGLWETRDGHLVLPSSLVNPIFLFFAFSHPPWREQDGSQLQINIRGEASKNVKTAYHQCPTCQAHNPGTTVFVPRFQTSSPWTH